MCVLLLIIILMLNVEVGLVVMFEVLMEGLFVGLICEVIVSDGGFGDWFLDIVDEVGCVIVIGVVFWGG